MSILLLGSNFSGTIGPILTGFIVERTGVFFWAFAVMSIMALIGATSVVFIVRRIEPVVWHDLSLRS